MSLLEEVQFNEYRRRIEQAYYLTLVDILMGVPLEEIEQEIYVYAVSYTHLTLPTTPYV